MGKKKKKKSSFSSYLNRYGLRFYFTHLDIISWDMTRLSPLLTIYHKNIKALATMVYLSFAGWWDGSKLDQSGIWNGDERSLTSFLWILKDIGSKTEPTTGDHVGQRSRDEETVYIQREERRMKQMCTN